MCRATPFAALAALLVLTGGALVPAHAALPQAWQLAQANDPQWLQALAERDAGLEDEHLARAQLLPQVSASATRGRADSTITQQSALGPVSNDRLYSTQSWALQVRQALFRARAFAGYAQGQASAAAAEARLAAARQGLLARLIEAAANLAQGQADLNAAQVAQRSARRLADLASRQLKAGEVTRNDAARAAVRLSRANQDVTEAELLLESARVAWRTLTGQATPPALTLDAGLNALLPIDAGDTDALLALARDQSPDLNAARQDQEVARQEVRKARSDHLPTLDLVASRTFNDSTSDNIIGSRFNTARVDLQVNLPLYSGGAVNATIRQAQARARRADAVMQGVEARLRLAIGQSLSRLKDAREDAAKARADRALAQGTLRSAELGQTAGTATLGDMADAQAALATAERDLARANASSLIVWRRFRAPWVA